MDKIINQMKSLGLTEYEVKAYLALLQNHPSNGYALSKVSGIPRSRVYEVLDGLKKKQIVFEQSDGKNNTYTPLEPSLLMGKIKSDFESVIESIDNYTNSLYNNEQLNLEPKILSGRDEILKMVQVLIKEAKNRIALSIWDEELVPINDELEKAKQKGILLRGVYFGKNNPFKELISHRRIDRYLAECKERYIIVIIDDKHVLSGIISRNEDAKITWSTDPGILQISDDSIAHDVMINTYYTILKGKERTLYEKTFDEIRKKYYGFSDEEFELFPLPKEE
ncbi:TrmB family transcriptional regulator [Clostridium sp. DL1XJH146]